jgi:hypothetical protein
MTSTCPPSWITTTFLPISIAFPRGMPCDSAAMNCAQSINPFPAVGGSLFPDPGSSDLEFRELRIPIIREDIGN